MRNETRVLYNDYRRIVAQVNGVEDAREMFTVAPPIAQSMEDTIREEAGFLDRIGSQTVINMKGETIGLDIGSTVASVTKTSGTTEEREPVEVVSLEKTNEYEVDQVDFDTAIRYSTLDQWRVYPDFAERYARQLARQIGRDRIMIGWHGEGRAALKSDRVVNPRLQDVAKGWLAKISEFAPDRIHTDPLTLGTAGDYKNLDALVYDLIENKMAEHHREDTDLVCIVGRRLLHDKYLGLMNDNNAATERIALDVLFSTRQVAGMPAIVVPFFPADGILVTRLDNLSIYTQEGSLRRLMRERPEKNRVEDFMSQNMDYVIEDYTCLAQVAAGAITLAN
ncbi:phage major capsid protein, P2 family [uncultured Thiothrix sp.]|uniref:phage major capsid protein, P2 family n=1 Tax=uncultured Thiothrix sp. TaxID=223185 RepID=UPI002619DA9C|nr:phage major capsid protein, P2 family [uncultured Thiothrix sp.]